MIRRLVRWLDSHLWVYAILMLALLAASTLITD